MTYQPRRILITGCSAAGKSTLLVEVARRGWVTVPEPGRRVIAAERAAGGDGLPWVDLERFARLCLEMAIADWEAAGPGITLFDRGIFDAAINLRHMGQDIGDALTRYRYDPLVLLAEPWPELFAADADRKHGMDAALAEFELLRAGLDEFGYRAEPLPKVSVTDRADWLESRLASG
ncbi:AAA family ATPase [Pseudoruegeria sp. HB172150]|uniref:AAA family ATPase n=1 Tax=Pseudoruegeria sp. HB172150 TaxID=2721164 RepID=UPI001551FF65|nr:AAA family ATPase [Pseudoruegeria sp. HB172150]